MIKFLHYAFLFMCLALPRQALGQENLSLAQKVGQMIIIGFQGTSIADQEVRDLVELARQGSIGGGDFF